MYEVLLGGQWIQVNNGIEEMHQGRPTGWLFWGYVGQRTVPADPAGLVCSNGSGHAAPGEWRMVPTPTPQGGVDI